MDRRGIQRAALAIAKMRTPKAVKRARWDIERLRDWWLLMKQGLSTPIGAFKLALLA